MINEICQYAERENLVGDPNFFEKEIPWDIKLSLDGSVCIPINYTKEIINIDDKNPKKKKKEKIARLLSVPFISSGAIGGNKQYYFLIGTIDAFFTKSNNDLTVINNRLNSFKQMIKDAINECPTYKKHLESVLRLIDNKSECDKLAEYFIKNKIKTHQFVTFTVDDDRLIEQEELKCFWRKYRNNLPNDNVIKNSLCMISGKYTDVVKTFEPVSGVVQGGAASSLISYDKPSYESYGLSKGENGSISIDSELKLRAGLQDLIKKSTRVENVQFLHWTKEKSDDYVVDLLTYHDPDTVKKLIKSPFTNNNIPNVQSDVYYVVCIQGNKRRIIIKDFSINNLETVKHNIEEWFSDLNITGNDNYGILQLLAAIKINKKEKIEDRNIISLYKSALSNYQISYNIFAMAVQRTCMGVIKTEIKPELLSLIKLYLKRNGTNMTNVLDELNMHPAYLCGRLYAMMNKLYELAMGKDRKSFITSMCSRAASNPGYTFPILIKKIEDVDYYSLANNKYTGSGTKKFNEIKNIMANLNPFPKTFSLYEQSIFFVAYYQQIKFYEDYRKNNLVNTPEK